MPGAADFNVSVRVSLIDQVTRSLAAMAGAFGGTERMALNLKRRLRELSATRALSIQKSQLAQRVDRDALTLLNARYSKLMTLGDLEATQEERRQLNARIVATEQRAQIRRQVEMIRLQRESNDIAEKRALLGRALVAARGERMMAGLGAVGGVGAIGAGLTLGTLELAKKGLAITQLQSQLQIAGGLNQKQVQALSQRALALSQKLGVIDFGSELKMALQLYQTLPAKLASQMLGPVSFAADLAQLMNRGSAVTSAGQIARSANILGAVNPGQAFAVSTDIANVLRSGGAGITMGELSNFMTFVGGVMPGRTVAQRAAQMESWALLAGRFGGLQGAFSGENIQHLVRQLTQPKSGLEVAAIQQLERFGLARRPDQRTFGNILMALRRGETAQPNAMLRTLDLLLGRSPGVAMAHLIQRLSPQTIQGIANAPLHNLTIQQMWAVQMKSASGQFEQMNSRLKTLSQVIGVQLDPSLKTTSGYISGMAAQLTAFVQQHPQGLKLLGQDVALFTKIVLRAGGLLATLGGPGILAGLKAVNEVLEADVAALKFIRHPGQGAKNAAHGLVADYVSAVKHTGSVALGLAERAGIVHVTGPVHVHMSGVNDPKEFTRQLKRSLMSQSGTAQPTVSGHVVAPTGR